MSRWIVRSRLRFPSLVFALTLAVAASAPVAAGPEPPGLVLRYADTIIINGKIATVDPAFQFVEALAIRDGRILAVGSQAYVESLAGPETRRIDVGGRTVIPGLIDTHEHLHEYALDHWESDIAAVEPKFSEYVQGAAVEGMSVAEVLPAIEAAAASREPGSWINVQLASTALDRKSVV
jgi:predicted amidohydrolase YtcJ